MSKENMKILINGYLDVQNTTNIINKQLRQIEKNLKLKLGIDNKQLANLVRDVEKIQSKLNGKVSPISDKDTKQAKVFVDSIEKAVEQYGKLGQVKISQKINPNTKEIEAFTLAVTQADGKLKELQFTQSKLKGIHGVGNFALTGESLKDSTASIRERQLQQEQQINRQIEQQNQKLKHQLEMYKQEANLKAKNLMNANKGNKNFDEASVRNWLNSVNALNTSTPQVSQQMDRLRMQFRSISSDAQASSNQMRNFGSTMENAFSRMPIYMAASAALFAPFVALNKLIDTLYILDERLVTIDKVTENISLAEIFDNATQSAFKFGRTIDGALETLGEIVKLGYSAKEAGILSNNSLLMATVGEMADIDSANYLVAITRQYKLEVQETSKVVDAFNELSNKSGATVKGLAEGLSKSSAGAAQAGVSFHDLNGMMATTIETLKISGNEAGTFYKTLFNRYLRERTQTALNEIGIQTKNMNGELRSATDVLQELGKKWSQLDSQQKNAIASQLGGGWHINKVTSLIENQARAYENAQFSLNSYNSAQKELETYQEGLRFKTNNMIASFQELAMTIGETGARDGIVKFLETVTSMTKGFTDLTEATDGWNIKLPVLIGLVYGGVKAFGALKLAITGVRASLGIFSVGLVAVETLASMFIKSAKSASLNTEALSDLAKKTSDQAFEVQKLVKEYNQLEPQAKNNTEKQNQLHAILNEIHKLAPHLVESTGQYGEALTLNKEKADLYIESLKTMTQEQLTLAQSANSIEISTVNVEIDKEKEKLSKLEKSVKDSFERMQEYQNKYNVKGLQDAEEEYNKRRVELANKASEAIDKGNKELANRMTVQLTTMLSEYAEYVKIMEDKNGKLEDYSDQISKIQELENKKQGIEERSKALEEMASKTEKGTLANSQNADSLTKLNDGIYESIDGMDDLSNSMENVEGNADKLQKQYDNAISNISSLNGVINELNDGHKVSADSIAFLMERYDHLLPLLGDETALRKAIQEEILNEEKIAKQAILNKMAYSEQFYNSVLTANADFVNQFKSHYGIDLQNFKNLASAKMAVDDALRKSLSEAWTAYSTQVTNVVSAAKLAMGSIGMMSGSTLMGLNFANMTADAYKYMKASQSFQGIFMDSISAGTSEIGKVGLSDPKKSKDKSGSDKKVEKYLSDEYAKVLDNLNLKLEQSRARQKAYNETSAEYRKELDTQISLHNEINKLTNNEIARLEKKNKSLSSTLKSMGDFNKLSNKQKEKYNEIAKEIDNNSQAINKLKTDTLSFTETIQGLSYEKVNSSAKKFTETIEELDYQLSLSRSKQSLYEEGSAEWRREVEHQNKLLEDKVRVTLDYRATLQKLLNEENLSIEAKKELSKTIDDLTLSYYDLKNGIKNNIDALNKQLINSLTKIKDEFLNGLKEASNKTIKYLEDAIKATEEYYNPLIQRQKEYLDQLEEQIEKEDRIKKLREINEEIAKVKADKRFEFITEDGQKILTYDKAKVNELEKQHDEMLKQYEREDVKKAIRDEIDRLEKAKNDKIEQLRQEIELTKQKYDEQIALEEKRWNDLIEKASNGTLKFDEFMNDWYDSSLSGLFNYVSELESQFEIIKSIFNSLSSMSVDMSSSSGSSKSNPFGMSDSDFNKYVQNKANWESGVNKSQSAAENAALRDKYGIEKDTYSYNDLKKYHDGGIVDGSTSKMPQLLNALLNTELKQGETFTKSLIGEIQVPPKHFPNILNNVRMLANSITPQMPTIKSGDTFNLHNVTIQANDPNQLLDGLRFAVMSNRP